MQSPSRISEDEWKNLILSELPKLGLVCSQRVGQFYLQGEEVSQKWAPNHRVLSLSCPILESKKNKMQK